MQDEILEMHEFAVHPELSMCLEEVESFKKPLADRRAGNPLVQPDKREGSLRNRPQEALDWQFSTIVEHEFMVHEPLRSYI